jgi:hypothetical protein
MGRLIGDDVREGDIPTVLLPMLIEERERPEFDRCRVNVMYQLNGTQRIPIERGNGVLIAGERATQKL